MLEDHLDYIRTQYRVNIPKKTILVWSLLLTWHNNGNTNPLRKELEHHASVPVGTFDGFIQDFCDRKILDNPQSCRLNNANGSFTCVQKIVQDEIGPLDDLPFDKFRFKPQNRNFMQNVWVNGGYELLLEIWETIPTIRPEIISINVSRNEWVKIFHFSTNESQPSLLFYFYPKPKPQTKVEFAPLFSTKADILEKQSRGELPSKGVIALSAALSFGEKTFEGNINVLMLGPITLMMIVTCFRRNREHSTKLYNAFIEFLEKQRDGIIRGGSLIEHLQKIAEENNNL